MNMHCRSNTRASPPPASARAERGFTVLETLVTLALVALLSAVAAPGMIDFIRNNRLSTAARQLDADMLLARREAIKRNARVLVCPKGSVAGKCATATTTAWTSGWLVCYDMNADGDCDDTATGNPNPIRQHAALEATLTLTGPAAVARFNANGTQGAAGAGSLTFTTRGTWSGSKSYVETISATGNVAIAAGS
jgi:type IV fimbrial biogenesis protein FimT